MKKSTFDFEKNLSEKGYEIVIGIDEAGRGPLAGPVVASAVFLKNRDLLKEDFDEKELDLVRDSKKLSPKQREKVFEFVHEHFDVGVGICNHETIDRMNILEASFLAMKEAISDLRKKLGQKFNEDKLVILVDGNKEIPNFSLRQEAVIGGDGIVKSISAASIIAKVMRDRIMLEAHETYPEYDFDRHKGYGTKLHMEKIHKYGPCKIHRKSFEPMKSLAKSRV